MLARRAIWFPRKHPSSLKWPHFLTSRCSAVTLSVGKWKMAARRHNIFPAFPVNAIHIKPLYIVVQKAYWTVIYRRNRSSASVGRNALFKCPPVQDAVAACSFINVSSTYPYSPRVTHPPKMHLSWILSTLKRLLKRNARGWIRTKNLVHNKLKSRFQNSDTKKRENFLRKSIKVSYKANILKRYFSKYILHNYLNCFTWVNPRYLIGMLLKIAC